MGGVGSPKVGVKLWWPLFSEGVDKQAKKIQNFLAWISDILETVWQGESGEPKTVFQILFVGLHKRFFCVADGLILLIV